MRTKIENIDDLRAEIDRLSQDRVLLEADLKHQAENIVAKIKAPFLLINKLSQFLGIGRDKQEGDWVSSIFRIGLPVLLNRYIFPKSGFIMKTILALITQNAAKIINKDFVSKLIEKISDWVKKSGEKSKKEPKMADYGIPPDSETY